MRSPNELIGLTVEQVEQIDDDSLVITFSDGYRLYAGDEPTVYGPSYLEAVYGPAPQQEGASHGIS